MLEGLQQTLAPATTWIATHPIHALVVVASLTVLVIFLLYKAYGKGKFSPKWQLGSADAGSGGTMPRSAPGGAANWAGPVQVGGVFADDDARDGVCPAGSSPVVTRVGDVAGGVSTLVTCKRGTQGVDCFNTTWDPEAVSEAQALSSVGSLDHSHSGNPALQFAIDSGQGLA